MKEECAVKCVSLKQASKQLTQVYDIDKYAHNIETTE